MANLTQTPQEELQAFLQMQQQRKQLADAANTGDPAAVKAFNDFIDSVDPKTFAGGNLSPAAKALTERVDPQTGKTMLLDPQSGQYSIEKKGYWSHPESWIQLAAGGALAGAGAAGLLPGALGGATGGSGAAGSAALGADAAGVGATSGLASGAGIGTAVAAPTLADVSGVVAGDVAGGLGGSTLGKVTGLLGKGGGLSDILGAAGSGVGQATNAAAANRGAKANLAMDAQKTFETEMLNRAKEEQSQRNDALKQGYYANYVQNRKPGPFNTAGITPYGSDTLSTAMNLAQQSKAKLANAPQYDTNGMPKLPTAQEFTDEYGNPSTMEKVGNWLSPALTTLGKVSRFF